MSTVEIGEPQPEGLVTAEFPIDRERLELQSHLAGIRAVQAQALAEYPMIGSESDLLVNAKNVKTIAPAFEAFCESKFPGLVADTPDVLAQAGITGNSRN